jgi:hypothetical protein
MATDDDTLQLASWCAANRLPECAEWLLRDVLFGHFSAPDHPAYRRAMAEWLPLGERRAPPFTFDLPVRGEWYVDRDSSGNLRRKHSAAFARNLMVIRGGRQFSGPEGDAASYFAWGQPFHAVGDGRIERVDDKHPDPPCGRSVGFEEANYITQDLGGGVNAYYGHIKSNSAKVGAGDCVKRGQPLGQVGNSGGNGLPHLHFMLLDGDYFSVPGRYRFEENGGARWELRDGADMKEATYVRPTVSPAPAPKKKGK